MDLTKVLEAHKTLLCHNKEDPDFVEYSDKIPFCHTPGQDGMVYPHHNYHGGRWVDRVNTTPQFISRPDDLFICCFPRSGSNWSQNMIKHILSVPLETITIDLVRWFEGHSNEQLDELPSPRMFKSHLHYDKLPRSAKSIYIARNPFDNCVATYEILRGYCTFGAEEMKWARYLDLYLEGSVLFGSWFQHVRQGWERAQSNPQDTLFLRYEDMKKDEAGTVIKISEFLGETITKDRAVEIADLTTFNRMKKDPTANHEWTKLFCNEGFDFIRKGIVGDYLNYFSEEEMKRMRDKLRETGVECFEEFL